MERAFETILRWLNVNDEFELKSNNIIEMVLPKNMFLILLERVKDNITLNSELKVAAQDSFVIERREFIDNYWGRCRLEVTENSENTTLQYKFLGYEAVVEGTVVIVDSIKTKMELED